MVKVELHCHLDGAIPPKLFLQLSKKLNLVDTDDQTWLNSHIIHENMPLVECLKYFDLLISLLQTKEHLSMVTEGIIDMKYKEGVRLLELRFAPQEHNKLSMEEATLAVLDGLNKGKAKHPDMVVGIIVAMMNNDAMDLNDKTIDIAYKYKDKGIVGIDLAGNEGYNKIDAFDSLLEKAHNLGLNITLHAGESQGPEFVKKAIDNHANRIGHGIHAIYDQKVVDELIDKKILLEISPTSNIFSNCVSSFDEHPVRSFFDQGVPINISTDDPLLLDLDIDHEYDILRNKFNFTEKELMQINLYSAKASFCKDKDMIIKQIEEEIKRA